MRSKSVEIRVGKKGYIVVAKRSPILRFEDAEQAEVEGLMSAIACGDTCAIKDKNMSFVELPPVEWAVASADEALSIARKLLEGESFSE